MVEEIRSMWCDALEELLQCPVCLETSPDPKIQCINGHHLCTQCKSQMHSCPMCKSNFINTRNLAVEQISAKLKDIKLSLMNPYHDLNKRILKDKICVSTQTEENICMPSTSSECQTEDKFQDIKRTEPQNLVILSPKIGKGFFPCQIGSCTQELPHGRMIGHLRYYHKNMFCEFNIKSSVFKRYWNLEYILNRNYDFAFFIKGMGLFFLNILIHQKGDLTGILRIVNNSDAGKQFMYTLEMGNFRNKIHYTGVVKSCRVSKESLSENCLYIRNHNMHRIVGNKNTFCCYLILKRKSNYQTEFTVESNPMELT